MDVYTCILFIHCMWDCMHDVVYIRNLCSLFFEHLLLQSKINNKIQKIQLGSNYNVKKILAF